MATKYEVPYTRSTLTGSELANVQRALESGVTAGDGPFSKACQKWLEDNTCTHRALLTHSCTGALEMCALLLDLRPGDEVIMPSFTFVSTATAFLRSGATPVFIDVSAETLNLDPQAVEVAITSKTKAIVCVHYAGIACDMDALLKIGCARGIPVIEDAAQGLLSYHKDAHLGTIGDLGTISFHQTKNIGCGEGGALLIRDESLLERAEIIREKGTDRSRFIRGEVDRYTWRDIGSSFLPSDIQAGVLLAQLESAEVITQRRVQIWNSYRERLASIASDGRIRLAELPTYARKHNAHIFFMLFRSEAERIAAQDALAAAGIQALTHFVPLHLSPAGRSLGRTSGSLAVTESIHAKILRLPVWPGMEDHIDRITATVSAALR